MYFLMQLSEETSTDVPTEHAHELDHESSGEHEHIQGLSHHEQPLILLFVFFGLFIGGLLREVNKKTKFPYTPMLIIAGIILGHWDDNLGSVGRSA